MSSISDRPWFLSCAVPLLVLYGCTFILRDSAEIIALVPANTLITHTYAWNMVTSCFFEMNPLMVIMDLVLLWVTTDKIGSPSIEQFGLYFVFNILSCTIGTSMYSILRFVGTGLERPLIVPTYGMGGIIMAFLMLMRQQYKSQAISSRYPSVTYHHLPIIFALLKTILFVAGLKSFSADLSFTWVALLFSWSYLRFYYKYTEIDPPGDKSEDFSFVTMFPEAAHIVLVPFTTAFYNIMALVGAFPPLEVTERKVHHHLRPAPTPAAQDSPKNPVQAPKQDMIAERRRAKAMKILDAKLAALANEPDGWDDVAEEVGQGESLASEMGRFKV